MTDTAATTTRPTTRGRAGTIALWVLQVALAAVFVGAGVVKLIGDPTMVDVFARVGAGQWLRYVVGVLEVAGAVGLLVPRLAGLAALGLTALMAGATVANLTVLGDNPIPSIGLMLLTGLVAWLRRGEITALAGSRRRI